MTVFHLLRHGDHGLVGRTLPGRTPGVALSPKGRADVALVASRLEGERIEAIYASPLERTQESALILAERLKLPVATREDLIELDYGEWTGWTYEAVRADPRWQRWREQRGIARIPGGETMREVQNRVVNALVAIGAEHPDGNVLLVSHGDVIRAALLFALGMPLDFYARLEIAVASLSTIRIDPAGIRVFLLGERPPRQPRE